MAATRRLSQLVSSTLRRLQLPEDPVVVALSGGADSAALAYLVGQSGREARALHVDHGFPASSALAEAAAAIGDTLDLDLEVVRVQVPEGPSLEERAREARYEVLHAVAGSVVTAHTLDDSVETTLINLIRGTGSAGLGGVPEVRPPNVYRPILDITRNETREIATLAGLPFVDDPMNDDLALTRNRIRLEILPLMRELNPQVEAAIRRVARIVGEEGQLIESAASPNVAETVPASVLTTLPRPVAERVVIGFLQAHGLGASAETVTRVMEVAAGRSDRRDLSAGRTVVRRGAMVVVEESPQS